MIEGEEREAKRLYWVWADMLSRCRNSAHRQFKDYGGRGVTVCERWHSFQNFKLDMAPRPSGMSIDRIDNEKGYSLSNCKWSTRKEQNSNRRNCIYVTHGEDQVTLKEYCRREGKNYRAVVKRIRDRGWPVQDALSLPMGARLFNRDGTPVEAA